MAALWIGTSGWVYGHWVGVFYPPKLPGDRWLPFYAERFSTVEVNYSFYRLPERSVFEAWRAQTPPGFLLAVKGSRYLTHMKKLTDPEEPLSRLMERVAGLGDKLGPILFQFPPTWTVDAGRLAGFLDALQPYASGQPLPLGVAAGAAGAERPSNEGDRGRQEPQRFAFEFRHASWLTPPVYELLERTQAALCLPVGPGVPLDVRLTAPWTYLRLHRGQHGVGYGDDELRRWADRVRGFLAEGADAYVYFNNDPGGHALRDAERLRGLLS